MASYPVSPTTAKILKNFGGISNSIILVPGTTQKTLAKAKALMAVAEFPDAWPQETGIYDVGTFLSILSNFKAPEIRFEETAMVIFQGGTRVRYRYSDTSTIQTPPTKTLPVSPGALEYTISAEALAQLNKTCALLKLEEVIIKVENGTVTFRASNPNNPASNAFEYDVPEKDVVCHDMSFEAEHKYKREHLTMLLDGSYHVTMNNWTYAYFKHESEPVGYYVVAQF